MPINVICPSCHARFNVSDKFAGQTGPCPKCKKPIRIPEASEEVVIHTPEHSGPTDSSGQSVLKPIEREETEFSGVTIAIIIGVCLISLVVAFVLGRMYKDTEGGPSIYILGAGALMLAPLLAYGCYSFLRNHELEPYRGGTLWIRSIICGVVYAILWGVFTLVVNQVFGGELEMFHYAFVGPPIVAAGAVAALACFDLDFMTGAIHYGIYVAVTVLMRVIMGLPAI